MKTGVVYVVTGERYRREACMSAASLKKHMPALRTTLFTEAPTGDGAFDDEVVIEQVQHNRLDKIAHMHRVPYERVLFLDTDTYICGDLAEVFELLDRFDLALALAPRRIHRLYPPWPGVPNAFAEFNSGVFAFRNTPEVRAMLSSWSRLYQEGLASEWYRQHRKRRPFVLQDQHFLRKALYESDLRIAPLPYEYNCRLMPSVVNGEVKVVHGHHADLPGVAKQINAVLQKRVIVPSAASLYHLGARENVLLPYFYVVNRAAAARRRLYTLFGKLTGRRSG